MPAARYLLLLAAVLLLGSLGAPALKAQTIQLSRHLDVINPTAVSLDRLGNFYLADKTRTVFQYSPLGQAMNNYSPPISGRVGTIEARTGVKVLLFYPDQQQVVILDRFMRELTSVNLTEKLENNLVKAISFSADDQLWLFDESEFALRKVDARTFQPIFNTPLNLIVPQSRYDVRFIREYQNQVYLVEKNSGIYVFDNMGNYKKKLPFPGLDYVGFRDDELYFLQDNEVRFHHLYKLTDRVLPLPAGQTWQNALVGEKTLYLFSQKGVDMFTLTE